MTHMKNVEYVVGSANVVNSPLQTYSNEALEFCALLSKNLMKSPALRAYPDISSLAFWCRRANLQKMKESCLEAENRVGRGLCFHVAPGNIPINFAFSYLFGLLAGCSNIVRISSRQYPQIEQVCEVVAETLANFPEIEKRTAFIRYQADDETTADFCRAADVRMIWGGDQTIAKVRIMPCKPRCLDICFADRYSICIMDGNAVLAAGDTELRRLIDNFYNDTYLMDQNACSSQQIVFWIHDSNEARNRFWNALSERAKKKYMLQPALGIDKYTHVFEDILDGRPVSAVQRDTNLLYRIELSELKGDLCELRGKGGYFYEYSLDGIDTLAPFITEKFQTVTYYGINPETIRRFVISNNLRGIDRIVPVGKAMDIGIMWDGFDLARVLSRYIDVE